GILRRQLVKGAARIEEVALGADFAIHPEWDRRLLIVPRGAARQTPARTLVIHDQHTRRIRADHVPRDGRGFLRVFVRGGILHALELHGAIEFVVALLSRLAVTYRQRGEGERALVLAARPHHAAEEV